MSSSQLNLCGKWIFMSFWHLFNHFFNHFFNHLSNHFSMTVQSLVHISITLCLFLQKKAWRVHKAECPCFQRVAPKLPMENVLLFFQLVLRHEVNSNETSSWYYFQDLLALSIVPLSQQLMIMSYHSCTFSASNDCVHCDVIPVKFWYSHVLFNVLILQKGESTSIKSEYLGKNRCFEDLMSRKWNFKM